GLKNSSVTPVSAIPVDTKAPAGLANLVVIPSLNSLSLSWNKADNADGDLDSYRISYNDNGQPKTITLKQADVGSVNPITYQLNGLASATAYDIRVSAVDSLGNTSAPLINPGITLLNNPEGLMITPLSSSAELTWSPVLPRSYLKHYAVYVSSQ